MFCSNKPETWKCYLPTAEFAHNQRTHSAVKYSPFYLMMGYEPLGLPTIFLKTNIPEAEKRSTALFHARNEAQAAHELAQQTMMERITQKLIPFKKGDEVWLNSKNLRLPYLTRKLTPKWEGPFPITEVISPLSYRLKLPTQWKIHPVFHAHLLTPFQETSAHRSNYLHPPPNLINSIEEHKVEFITKHRLCGQSHQYLVKWKGYPTACRQYVGTQIEFRTCCRIT
jgi:hypothetical protein